MKNSKSAAIFVIFFLVAVSLICFGQQDKEAKSSPFAIHQETQAIQSIQNFI